jgi:hypothetical protein
MKFKEWKRALREEQYDIPDVYNRIRPYAYGKKYPLRVKTFSFKKLSYTLAPVFVLLLFIVLTIFSTGYSERDSYLSGTNYLSRFSEDTDIAGFLDGERDKAASYFQTYRENSVFDAFKLDNKQNANLAVPDFSISSLNEYSEEAKVVASENNRIYYVSPSYLNVIDTENMDLEYSKNLGNYQNRANKYHSEIFLTDDYLILVYDEANDNPLIPYSDRTRILILDKFTYLEVFSYQIYGDYLDAQVQDNQLYVLNTISLRQFIDKGGSVPLPVIYENEVAKDITRSDIGYIEDFVGETYTIISCLNIDTEITSSDAILLSYDEWKIINIQKDGIYLLNNHQNTDEHLEYGIYTALIHYTFTKKEGLQYSSSCKFKGYILNQNSFSEYDGYIRLVTTVVDYDVTINFLQTRIKPVKISNRVVILKEMRYLNNKEMRVVSYFDLDTSEQIQAVRFEENEVFIKTETNSLYQINLDNPGRPKITNKSQNNHLPLFLYQLDETLAISLETDKTEASCSLKIYDINEDDLQTWALRYQIKYDNYSYFPVLEAVVNQNAIFSAKLFDRYYLGFSITNYNRTKGEYLLFEINPVTKSLNLHSFTNNQVKEQTYINRMVSITNNETYFYVISDNLIVIRNRNFEQMGMMPLPK